MVHTPFDLLGETLHEDAKDTMLDGVHEEKAPSNEGRPVRILKPSKLINVSEWVKK